MRAARWLPPTSSRWNTCSVNKPSAGSLDASWLPAESQWMRISILSNAPWASTGYGQQIKLVAPRLKALGHEISIQGYYGHSGSPIDWGGIQVYGVASQPFGQDVMNAAAMHFKADILISNMDAWVMEPAMLGDTKWVAWFPVDSDPIPPLVLEKVKQAWHRIVWTDFGARQMDNAGLDYDQIPYGVDCENFKPGDKQKAKQTVQWTDKFAVGMVAMNKGYPCRKAFFENIEAFKRFHDKHPDSFLYMHTLDGSRPNGETVDLAGFCKTQGLQVGQDVIFADQYSYVLGYPDNAMATLYNAMDVHLLVSMGEGFGMPQLEAQACGTPVICGDWTSMSEICFGGWKVSKHDAEKMWTLQNSYQYLPHVDAIVDKLEQAYQMRGNPEYSKRAREGAEKYDINRIVEKCWKPVLERIAEKIKSQPQDAEITSLMAGLR
jgi:glycosyltransferase involved in cell wall biosynthesis